jgi:hypothetical protein
MMGTTINIDLEFKILHPLQEEIANHPARYRVGVCGRQFGKTEVGKDTILERAIDGARCWWVAPVYAQATDVWREIKITLEPMSHLLEISEGNRNIYFPGGGRIGVRSVHDHKRIRGENLDFAVLDEAAFMADEVWPSVIEPMLLKRKGNALFLSTPFGMNWFYDIYMFGLDPGYPDWQSWQLPSSASPYISDNELLKIKRRTPERLYEQEYLAEFKVDGGAVFRGVQAVSTGQKQPPYEGDFVMGVDWGRDVDYTVVSVWDRNKLVEVDIDRYNQIGWKLQRDRILALYERWKPRLILAEANSIGSVNIEALQAEGLPVQPFMTTVSSKSPLIEGLALAIERGDCTLLNDPVANNEMIAYQLTRLKSGGYSYSAPSGKHDDIVIARALGYLAAAQPKMGSITVL